MALVIVFVHGWSVTNVDTYGELPIRIRNEAAARNIDIQIREIYLGKYISFHDEVRLPDISRAFRQAVTDELQDGSRFVCITHSTGGPVIRDWWNRYYIESGVACPMSHLVMLAPANFGSALAQLGKGRLSRIKSWFDGVEPGQGVLNWLELGSNEGWKLNMDWILKDDAVLTSQNVFPFVITGECIDRSLYDHLNSYTGELGSDGVVRCAAANLEGRYVKILQPIPVSKGGKEFTCGDFTLAMSKTAVKTPLRIVASKSHSGDKMGIMKSVKSEVTDENSSETVNAIFDCVSVKTAADYASIYLKFEAETAAVQVRERLETEKRLLLNDRFFIHDRFSMVIFKVLDTEGYPVADFDLILTASKGNEKGDPNHLPEGFLADRQRNHLSPETITYYFNYDIMNGCPAVITNEGKIIREALPGVDNLGMRIQPRPEDGFVKYMPCEIKANKELFNQVLKPNSTTLIEIRLQRMVYKETFMLEKLPVAGMPTKKDGEFKDVEPGDEIVT